MTRERNLLKNTIVLGIGAFLPKFASIILLPLLTGYLTKEEYGTYDLVTVLVSLILPTLTLQIQQAAFRFLIDARGNYEKTSSIITNIALFVTSLATIGSFVLYFVLPLNNRIVTLVVCLYYWTDVIENAFVQCARGMGDNISYSISAVICSVGQLVFALIFVRGMKLGMLGAALMLLFADISELIYIVLKARVFSYIDISRFSPAVIREMVSYSWPLVPNSMSMWVMRLSNRLVITFFLGSAANASFAVAYKIPQILSLAQHTFTMAWQENATMAASDSDTDAYYSKMFTITFDLIAGIMGLLIAATPVLFRLLIRGNYDDAYAHVPILLLGTFFYSISGFLGGIYVARMKTTSIGVTTVLAAIINLAIDIIGVPYLGLYAASGAVLISYLFLCIYRMVEVRKFVKLHYGLPRCCLIVLILVLMAVLCYNNVLAYNVINMVLGIGLFFLLDGHIVKTIATAIVSRFSQKKA